MIKKYAGFALIVVALTMALISLFGDDSFSRLQDLRQSLKQQRERNYEGRQNVANLKREVFGLQNDDRALEKAARNELGLARHGELIFIFDNYVDDATAPDEQGE